MSSSESFLELPFPVDTTVSKLMGSEGCGGAVKDLRSDGGGSINACSKLDSATSFPGQNAWNKMVNGEFSNSSAEKEGKESKIMSRIIPLISPGSEAKQHRKSGKVAKRSRLSQLEVCIKEIEMNDIDGKAKELGLAAAKGVALERTQTPKQKTNMNGKRGDKRNGKAPKSRYESFSVKSGLASFSSAAVGNNILGGYGLRAEMEDVTKQVDELSLNELLDGSYKCPNFSTDKGKKSADPNEKILQSVKDALSILQTRKIKPQIVEIDGNCQQEVVTPCNLTSDPFVSSTIEGTNVDTNMVDVSPSHKVHDFEIKLEASPDILEFPLYEPLEILKRLTLPPPKDLEYLLLDAAKPAAASRNTADLRPGKPANHRGCLPPFSWSNAYSGHCKSNVDAIKQSTNRSTCQGRWVKIENIITSPETTSCFLAELESLSYDSSIVPIECRSVVPAINEKDHPESVSYTEQGLSTCAVDPQASLAVHSPRVLAAAQLLCDMTADFSKMAGSSGANKSLKRPSQKSIRASYIKANEKAESISGTPKSKSKSRFGSPVNAPEFLFPLKKPRPSINEKSADFVQNKIIPRGQLLPSWGAPSRKTLNEQSAAIVQNDITSRGQLLPSWGSRPRLSLNEKTTEIVYNNVIPRGQLPNWFTPGSSRSSPGKSHRGSISETKPYNVLKKSSMLPPAARTLEPGSSSRPKPRKLMRIGWNTENRKLE